MMISEKILNKWEEEGISTKCPRCGNNKYITEVLDIQEDPCKENGYNSKRYKYYDNLYCTNCFEVQITDGSFPFSNQS